MFDIYKELEKEVELAKSKLNQEFQSILNRCGIENDCRTKFEFSTRKFLSTSDLYKYTEPFGLFITTEIKENENDEYYFNLLLKKNNCIKVDKFYLQECRYNGNVILVINDIKIRNYLFYPLRCIDEMSNVDERIKLESYFGRDILVKDLIEKMERNP